MTLIGLGAVLVTASGPAPDDTLSLPEALIVAGATAALIGALSRRGAKPGLRHAAASGVASGVASTLTQTVTVPATDSSGPLLDAQVIVVALLVAAFAAVGLLLSQTAYRGGLGAPLAMATLANPVYAAVIGLSLLGERLQGGIAGLFLAAGGAVLAARGVVLLTRTAPTAVPRPLPAAPAQLVTPPRALVVPPASIPLQPYPAPATPPACHRTALTPPSSTSVKASPRPPC